MRRNWRPIRDGLRLIAAAALLSGGIATAAPVPDQMIDRPAARLRGLDKITARTSTFRLAVGHAYRFGGLEVTLRACRENPPTETPESAAFVEAVDVGNDGRRTPVFSGWMFASSPALSAFEHPVYDVWVLSCTGAE